MAVEEKRLGYFHSSDCSLCNAQDKAGNNLRDLIDLRKDEGLSTARICEELKDDGLFFKVGTVDKHFRLHSPFLKAKKDQLKLARHTNKMSISQVVHRNAEEEIQKIVDLGAERIDSGELLVDKEMYMFALDRKSRNNAPLSIQNLVMNFGDALAEKLYEDRQPVMEGRLLDGDAS